MFGGLTGKEPLTDAWLRNHILKANGNFHFHVIVLLVDGKTFLEPSALSV